MKSSVLLSIFKQTMTTKLFSIVLLALLMSCNTETKKENETLKAQTLVLQQENDAFKTNTKKLNASIESYKKTLKEIDDNLRSIDKNATMVGNINAENSDSKDVKKDIMARIASIKALIDNSKLKVLALDRSLNELRKKYGDQSEEVLQLSKEIKEQSKVIIEKEIEFKLLVAEHETDIDELQASYDQQVLLTQQLSEIINRAFYVSGTSKELKAKEVVDVEGGFIGLGRVKVLNANSSDGLFKQIKKDATDTLTFNGKSAKLVTEHPADSYKLESTATNTSLIILDRSAFWKSGNYLVVETK
jgi:uncharacterized protein YukE